MCQYFMSGEEEAAMKVVWCSRARGCNDVLIRGAAGCCGALLRSWRLCLLQEEPEQEASCFSLSRFPMRVQAPPPSETPTCTSAACRKP